MDLIEALLDLEAGYFIFTSLGCTSRGGAE